MIVITTDTTLVIKTKALGALLHMSREDIYDHLKSMLCIDFELEVEDTHTTLKPLGGEGWSTDEDEFFTALAGIVEDNSMACLDTDTLELWQYTWKERRCHTYTGNVCWSLDGVHHEVTPILKPAPKSVPKHEIHIEKDTSSPSPIYSLRNGYYFIKDEALGDTSKYDYITAIYWSIEILTAWHCDFGVPSDFGFQGWLVHDKVEGEEPDIKQRHKDARHATVLHTAWMREELYRYRILHFHVTVLHKGGFLSEDEARKAAHDDLANLGK